MNIGKALLSTQDLSRCSWETVFPADSGNAYLVRKASNTRITLVKKRCARCLRVKLKPHSELPYSEGEEFLEVMSMDQRAGVWLVEESGSSGSSGPAVPEDVEEGEPVKKLVAPTAPTASEKSTWPVGMKCSEPGVVSVESDVAAIDCGYLNVRREPRFGSESATVIVGSTQPLCQRKVQTNMRLLNSRMM